MTNTYTPIASVTLSASSSEVVFSSIPATYRDLVLIGSGTATSNSFIGFRFNADTGSNYSRVAMAGDGGSAYSFSGTDTSLRVGPWRTEASNVVLQIMDYAQTDKQKTSLTRANNAAAETLAVAGRWANTSAINSITIRLDANQFASGSTFSLFGIAG